MTKSSFLHTTIPLNSTRRFKGFKVKKKKKKTPSHVHQSKLVGVL